jgi:error-prone DNA polymerase
MSSPFSPPPYAELHCLSSFSFLRGASDPELLVERALALDYRALAITDECSMAGVVRAHTRIKRLTAAAQEQARATGRLAPDQELPALLHLIMGSEFLVRDEAGHPLFKLVLLARNALGYGQICQLITTLRRACAVKGRYHLSWPQLQPHQLDECLLLLLPLRECSEAQHQAQADWLLRHFQGRAWLGVTLLRELDDELWLQRLQALSEASSLPLLACGDVHMHVRSRKPLQDALTAIRLGRPIAACGHALQANAERHLRPRIKLAQLYPPALLAQTVVVAGQCLFSLAELRYQYPDEVVPAGATPASHLRRLTYEGAARRWPAGIPARHRQQIEHELALIAEKRYEHYFLTVADIVTHARSLPQPILCQGRGSAANSVVCFCLHISAVDPDRSQLLFERFISRERDEPPDIDVDFEHERREEVIQYLYRKYGRERAALAATVISYRPRSALRDIGRALDLDEALVERLARDHNGWSTEVLPPERLQALQAELGLDPADARLQQLLSLSRQLLGMPRHLSQHVGGFVLTRGPLSQLVPIENAAMPDRTVIEWDKDDLDSLKLMKVDVLALGMLSALRRSFDFYRQWHGRTLSLASVPEGCEATYDMICRADTIGVFQIESRAQMSMLPRLRPDNFYDLVVEVAIVRPGPIEGGMVHPYLKNRARALRGEPIDYPPGLEAALARTYGVPIFQEQVMQVAMIAAGFSPGEADQLRRAMAAWKRPGDLQGFYDKIVQGMRARGYEEAFAESIFRQIKGFASYGFPESHAASFALLTYVSSWLKCHEPAIFLAALLNSQPLGFYTPSQLVQDARRHGVEVRPADVAHSELDCRLEPRTDRPDPAVRLGLRLVAGLSSAAAQRIVAARAQAPFAHAQDLARRAELGQGELQQLAAADALASLAGHRRQQVWQASALQRQLPLLAYAEPIEPELVLPAATEGEEVLWDHAALGLSLRSHPLQLLRPQLRRRGLHSSAELQDWPAGRLARACGIVTVRQRPQTAKGTLFISLEDEHGYVQVIVWKDVYQAHRSLILNARLLAVSGTWQRGDGGVQHLLARRFQDLSPLLGRLPTASRDFH